MTILDTELKSKFLTVICDTIVNSKNRNDFVVLMDELATACTIYIQTDLLSNKKYCQDFNNLKEQPEPTLNRFVKLYRLFKGDTDALAYTMCVAKRTIYKYKQMALSQGLLPESDVYTYLKKTDERCLLNDKKSDTINSEQNSLTKPDATISKMEKVEKPELFGRPHREKINLAEKLADTHFADVSNMVDDVSTDDSVADTSKTINPEQTTPVWLSENINLEEYWVYDFSKPVTIKCGNCGCPCVQTELWLVHRRKYKLSLVDAEFATLHALHDFLDPRKELATENNIYPLEKIDAELADNEKEQHAKLHADKKQSQMNRFIEFYHQFNGDPAQIAAAMGIQKQSVYAYKNKAKTMGVLK